MRDEPGENKEWIEEVADSFDRAWYAGQQPRIEDYLGEAKEITRSRLLRELLCVELELRFKRGEVPSPKEYRIKFPGNVLDIDFGFNANLISAWRIDAITSGPESNVGSCKLIGKISGGGMGDVYIARQAVPVRLVALKLIKPGNERDETVAQFGRERQILSEMDHPNIATVFEAGATDTDRPYFVMELIEGVAITEFCDKYRLTIHERLRLFVTVCGGILHAHQKVVIHTDIKPSNVLITFKDGDPVPKIIDFGLAKTINRQLAEDGNCLAGTPLYMSPEQANGTNLNTGTDIYSLGVLLYELLTGTTPLIPRSGETGLEVISRILNERIPKPSTRLNEPNESLAKILARRNSDLSTLTKQLRTELDWIVMKALKKEIANRYSTVSEFADEVNRYLNDEPVRAKPPSVRYSLGKFARRKRIVLASASAFFFLLLLGIVVSTWQAALAIKARNAVRLSQVTANDARKRAEIATFMAESRRLAVLSDTERSERPDLALLLAVEAVDKAKTREARDSLYRALVSRPDLHSFLTTDHADITSVAYSPDGKRLVAGCLNGMMLFDAEKHIRLRVISEAATEGAVWSVAYSPDGKTLAVGSNGTLAPGSNGGVVLFDTKYLTRLQSKPLAIPEGRVTNVTYSHDGKTLAAGYDGHNHPGGLRGGGVVLFDAASHKRLQAAPYIVDEGVVESVAYSPDGKTLATGYAGSESENSAFPRNTGGVVFFDAKKQKRIRAIHLHVTEGSVKCLAYSPDGMTLAVGHEGGVLLVDALKFTRHHDNPCGVSRAWISSLAYSPDGEKLAAGYSVSFGGSITNGGVVLFDAKYMTRLLKPRLGALWCGVLSVVFSPDGKTLAAGYYHPGYPGGVALIDPASDLDDDSSFTCNRGWVTRLNYSPDGKTFAASYKAMSRVKEEGVVLFDAAKYMQLRSAPLAVDSAEVATAAYSPDAKALAVGYNIGNTGGVALFDSRSLTRLKVAPMANSEGPVCHLAYSPEGKALVVARRHGIEFFDAVNLTRLQSLPMPNRAGNVTSLAFSSDGKSLAVVTESPSGVLLFGARGLSEFETTPTAELKAYVNCLAYSPDGKTLSVGKGGAVMLLSATSLKQLRYEYLNVKAKVVSLVYSPDGKALAAGYYSDLDYLGGVVLFDAVTLRHLQTDPILVKVRDVRSVAYSQDGKTLIVMGRDRAEILDVDLAFWRRRAEAVVNRNFSRNEWRQYFPDESYRLTFPNLLSPPEEHY